MPMLYLSLGSNLGDRQENLAEALDRLRTDGLEILRVSSLYETEPVGEAAGPGWFLNIAAAAEAGIAAPEALARCLDVERSMGRHRTVVGGPRNIDVDLLLAGESVVEEEGCKVPHPRMHLRRFVLEPLAEIAGGVRHPELGLTIAELLTKCEDPARARLIGPLAWPRVPGPGGIHGRAAEMRAAR